MTKKQEIKAEVILPDTPEGMAVFEAAMAKFNTQLLVAALKKIDATNEAKRAYIASLNGIAPWAKKLEGESDA